MTRWMFGMLAVAVVLAALPTTARAGNKLEDIVSDRALNVALNGAQEALTGASKTGTLEKDLVFKKTFKSGENTLEAQLTLTDIAYEVTIKSVDFIALDPISNDTCDFVVDLTTLKIEFTAILDGTLNGNSKTFTFEDNSFAVQDVKVTGRMKVVSTDPVEVEVSNVKITYKGKTIDLEMPDMPQPTEAAPTAFKKSKLKPFVKDLTKAIRKKLKKKVAPKMVLGEALPKLLKRKIKKYMK